MKRKIVISEKSMKKTKLISISCPYCNANEPALFMQENGYDLMQCQKCDFLYVNPRPSSASIDETVHTGVHTELGGHNVTARRIEGKVKLYQKLFKKTMPDAFKSQAPISWLDIGAGYAEIIEAVAELAPKGSRITGLEPMKPKADAAKKMGFNIINGYLGDVEEKFQYASLIHVFSHLPDFRSFLEELKSILEPGGELIIETGNLADVTKKNHIPGDLDLPDHLTFAGQKHLIGFLEDAGFTIVDIQVMRRNELLTFIKIIVKKLIGRKVNIVLPYVTECRNIMIRARLN